MKHSFSILKPTLLSLAALLVIGLLVACGGSGDATPTDPVTDAPTVAPTDAPTDVPTDLPTDLPTDGPTDGATEAPTDAPTEAPTEKPTIPPIVDIPDPSTITLMIEDFNSITDVKAALEPADLSMFGIEPAEWSFSDEHAQEGVAFVSSLSSAAWCQAYQLRGDRLSVFAQATDALYLRLYVCTPDNVSVALTVGLGSGEQMSFIDATKAIVTPFNGEPLVCGTSDATSDAGDGSAIHIPAGFEGYLALPLNALKAWGKSPALSALTAVDLIKIDVRPSGMSASDRYIFDALCLTDSPVAATQTGGAVKPSFTTKNEELQYMFDQVLAQEDIIIDYCPEFDPKGYPNVKAAWIQGPKMGNKDTKFFAFIGFPAGASKDNPVPAVVLNHGGGGYAYASWVDIWNQKGYAAIAIGNTGYAPVQPGMTDFYSNSSWTHTLTDEMLAADPRVLPPDNDGMYSSMGPIDRMWMYHAVSQTMLANTLMRNDERVITDQVGTTGISWGGVITSIAICYDSRFAFAVPVYGSGYLNESLSWMKQHFNADGSKELWDPMDQLKDVTMPVLWLAWTNDTCFSINTNSKSFDTAPNSTLTLLMNMGHGHIEGWNPGEIYRFADSVIGRSEGMSTLKTQPEGVGEVSFEIERPSDALRVTATVFYLDEKMTYSADSKIEQRWKKVNANVDGTTITATIPEEAYSYYVQITTVISAQEKYVTCSRYVVVKE